MNERLCKSAGQIQWEACEDFTLEKTAELTWVDADTIERAIKLYATTLSGYRHWSVRRYERAVLELHLRYYGPGHAVRQGEQAGRGAHRAEAESRHTARPTHFWCNRPYQETFGIGWTVG